MNPRFLLLVALAALVAIAAESAPPRRSHPFSASIEPGKVHEECLRLETGESRRYEWKSDSALDFNIHYHEDKEVFYPVKRDGVSRGQGRFKAKVAQDYCWMWTAKERAKIDGRIGK